MSNAEFIRICKEKVCAYTNEHMDKTDKKKITVDDVYVVWCCKTLQNHKALLSTTAPDGMYYELPRSWMHFRKSLEQIFLW